MLKSLLHLLVAGILLVASGMPACSKAQNISQHEARQIGAYYLTVATQAKAPIDPEKLVLAQQIDNPSLAIPALYVFNASNGFVVVSGSECVDPVLAYNDCGFIDTVENPACQAILDGYALHVMKHQNSQATPSASVMKQWQQVRSHTLAFDHSKAGSLLKSTWGQGNKSNPTYNIMCPQKDGYYCISGCVATAMSALIHYWKYPVVGGTEGNTTASTRWNNEIIKYKFRVDSNRFNYDSMPNSLKANSSYEAKRAIGKLMFACGVTVEMNWGPTASSAVTSKCVDALWRYFGYSQEATYQTRSGIDSASWNALLQSEIKDNGRPVLYRASSPRSNDRDANHCFVVCGVSAANESRYYINWGWNGSSNGFFTLTPESSMESAGGYDFTEGHAMIHHIYPDTISDVSIMDNTQFAGPVAYPNPATDYLIVPANLTYNAILTVFTATGAVVESMVVPAGTANFRIDLNQYPAGSYIYRLDGKAYKFVVAK